jgi:hypothetical protein
LLECFEKNLDPHGLLCQDIFGKDYEHADGWGPEGFSVARKPPKGKAKSMRDVMKTFRYASIYWADPNTVWRVLTSTETDDAQLPYANMTSRQVRTFHRRWLKAEPEWLQAWQLMLNIFAAQGYIEEPVMGRRSGGLSDGKKNEVVNFPILAAESSLMRIAEIRIRDAFPYEFAGPGTGMIHQCHDSIAVEVPLPPGCDPLWKPKRGEPSAADAGVLEKPGRGVHDCPGARVACRPHLRGRCRSNIERRIGVMMQQIGRWFLGAQSGEQASPRLNRCAWTSSLACAVVVGSLS